MKNIFLLMLLFAGMVKAQIVNIPDANLKAALVTAASDTSNLIAYNASGTMVPIDTNGDGEIDYSEAALITGLQLNGLQMLHLTFSDSTGLEAFVNLDVLDISGNPIGSIDTSLLPSSLLAFNCVNCGLTTLDISPLPNLVSLGCSENALTSIDVSNRPALMSLLCQENALTSLDLSGCTALEFLSCSNNPLTSVNLSDSHNLRYYYCMSNLFTSLDISGFPLLQELYCDNNQITNINFGSTTSLRTLYSRGNPLSGNIDFSQLTNLEMLACRSNNQTLLDVSHNTNLRFLDCAGNNLTAIDVSMLTHLTQFDCSLNPITTLDVSALTQLNLLYCHDTTIQTLFIKNGMAEDININNNPNLVYVCADDNQTQYIQTIVPPNAVVNSYCSFTPGGNYNTITGNIKYDANQDGCDSNDLTPSNLRVNINDGTNQGATFTHSDGNYTFYTQAGSFDIATDIENSAWFTVSPATATIPFVDNNNNTATQDFCISANGVHQDLESVISPVTPARPGFDAVYKIVYRNKGNTILPTEQFGIILQYDANKLDYVSSSQLVTFVGSNSINFGYTTLQPFESRSILVTLHVHGPSDSNPVNIGDVLTFISGISPHNNDENEADNSFFYHQTVVGSYDPNDITCLEGAVVPPSEIGNYLHYTINFENTGTFPAENVVVKTDVDATKFDINSLQLMNSNFPVDARITGNKVEFIFKNINLGIGGHGHILLKIKTQNTLVTGDMVSKQANIFFDYNAPVDTELANTIFQNLSNTDFEKDDSVSIYPNPTHKEVFVSSDNAIKSIQLFDVQGRILETDLIHDVAAKLDISSHSKGVYFIKITTEKGIKVQKLLKN